MLLWLRILKRQTFNVHNITYESAEVTQFQNAYSETVVAPTIDKTCEKRVQYTPLLILHRGDR